MSVLTRLQIEEIARRHFGDLGEGRVAVATAIAFAESGGDTRAVNDNYPRYQSADSAARWDYGLMQINSMHGYDEAPLMDEDFNMRVARRIYTLQGWNAWTTWRLGTAQQHLQETTPPVPFTPAPAPATTELVSFEIEKLPFVEFDVFARNEFVIGVYQRAYGYTVPTTIRLMPTGPKGERRYLVELPPR